jgi:hypothetical protein
MAAGLILAKAADADGSPLSDVSDEFDSLTAGGVRQEFALVAVKEFFAFFCFSRIKFEDLRDEFGFGSERGKPDIEVAVARPAVFWNSPRGVARHSDAETLLWSNGCTDLKG